MRRASYTAAGMAALVLFLMGHAPAARADAGFAQWLPTMLALPTASFDASKLMRMPPKPWVCWFQCPFWQDLKHANVDASCGDNGEASKNSARGICPLRWAFGPQSQWAHNAQYFVNEYGGGAKGGWPGCAVDEWNVKAGVPAEKWCAEGLRETKRKYPNYFLAVWVTTPTPTFLSLMRDGTIDLALIEGYSFVPNHPDWSISFKDLIKNRVEVMKRAGVLDRTIVCVGQCSAVKDKYGNQMTNVELVDQVRYIAHHYPEMPGIAFYGGGDANNPPSRKLIHLADRLSAYYYPIKRAK